jgi:hypothetical protein
MINSATRRTLQVNQSTQLGCRVSSRLFTTGHHANVDTSLDLGKPGARIKTLPDLETPRLERAHSVVGSIDNKTANSLTRFPENQDNSRLLPESVSSILS